MKLKPRSINGSSRAVLLGAVTGTAAYFGMAPCLFAQATPNTRLVDYVSPSLLSAPCAARPAIRTNATPAAEAKVCDLGDCLKPACATAADRWMIFESEYGIQDASPSPIGRMFQAAKYGLDRMTFTAQEGAKSLEFTHNIADEPSGDTALQDVTPQYSLPMFGKFGHAQIKSEVTIHDPQTGEAFIGLKLAIPFGKGG